ncbi:MAG: hypothetical protein KIS96_05510 [Bauldia sp.]|nr:hypothetical protein [Bauldia sp.]
MVRLAGLFALAAMLMTAAPAAAQQAGGRFQLTQEGDGFLRLDTESGAVSFCQQVEGAWRCAPADMTEPGEQQAEFETALAALTERLIVIETLLADLTAAPAADASSEIAALRDEIARLTEAQAALAATIAPVEPVAPPVDPTEALAALGAEMARLVEAQEALASTIEAQGLPADPGEDLAALRAEVARLADAQQALAGVIDAQALPADPTEELAALQAEVARLAAAQDGLAAALAESAPAPVADPAPALARIEQMLATLRAAQDALAGDQRSLATAQAALEVQWAAFAAEDRLAGIEATLVALAQEQHAITVAIADSATAAELAALAEAQAALAADVALLRETLAEIVALLIPPESAAPSEDAAPTPGFADELVGRLTEMVNRLRGN